MGFVQEFREFATKGNVLDLAVGVIIGAAFGKIVTSLVEDVLMPPLGYLIGKIDFSNMFVSLNGESFKTLADAKKAGAPVIGYGAFINNFIQFLLVAFAIFLIIKAANKLKKPIEVEAEAVVDLAAVNSEQNTRMIELLEKIAAK